MPINIVTCQVHPVLVKRIKCTVRVLSLPGAQGGLLETGDGISANFYQYPIFALSRYLIFISVRSQPISDILPQPISNILLIFQP